MARPSWPRSTASAAVEHLRDVGVLHDGKCLTLRLEPGDHLFAVHARLDELESDLAFHGLGLLGQVHDAQTAFSQGVQDLVVTDLVRLFRGSAWSFGKPVGEIRHFPAPTE